MSNHGYGNSVLPISGKENLTIFGRPGFQGEFIRSYEGERCGVHGRFLWGDFGPLDSTTNWPRPFDTEGVVNEVDGFDFDF